MHHSQSGNAFLITYRKIKNHLLKLSQLLQFYMHHGCAYTPIKGYENYSSILRTGVTWVQYHTLEGNGGCRRASLQLKYLLEKVVL